MEVELVLNHPVVLLQPIVGIYVIATFFQIVRNRRWFGSHFFHESCDRPHVDCIIIFSCTIQVMTLGLIGFRYGFIKVRNLHFGCGLHFSRTGGRLIKPNRSFTGALGQRENRVQVQKNNLRVGVWINRCYTYRLGTLGGT